MSNNNQKELPTGYRFLKIGEEVQFGDFYWDNRNRNWTEVTIPDQISAWKSDILIRRVMKKQAAQCR